MIKTIKYVDYGYMPNSMTFADKPDEEVKDHQFVNEAFFRLGWLEEDGRLILAFYSPTGIQKVLNDTESLTIMNLINREVEIEWLPETGPRIVKFLK